MPEAASVPIKYLQNLWDEAEAVAVAGDPLELLRYRSNLLGADLRITNFELVFPPPKFVMRRSAPSRFDR